MVFESGGVFLMAWSESAGYVAALYSCVCLLVGMLLLLLAYVLLSKRYKLNWFERSLLDVHQAEPPPSFTPVPPLLHTLHRQHSICHSDLSADESLPGTPNTPLGLSLGGSACPLAVEQGVALRYVQPTPTPRAKRTSMQTKLDHTKIDAAMYHQKQTVRTPSLPEDMRGSLRFSLVYEPEEGLLRVRLMRAMDLVAPGTDITSADPYAALSLLPDTVTRGKTSVHENNLQPVFDEEFTFEVEPGQIATKVLRVLVFDYDANARHRCMGSVKLALDRIDLSDKITLWKGISYCEEKDDQEELGEVTVSMSYLSSAERLTVVVLGARNLKAADDTKNTSDPYVKVCLVKGGKRVKKKKTCTVRGTLDPVFDEALTFDMPKDLLKDLTFELTVVHDNMLGPNEALGRVTITPQSKGEQAEHYVDVQRCRPPTPRSHSLVRPPN